MSNGVAVISVNMIVIIIILTSLYSDILQIRDPSSVADRMVHIMQIVCNKVVDDKTFKFSMDFISSKRDEFLERRTWTPPECMNCLITETLSEISEHMFHTYSKEYRKSNLSEYVIKSLECLRCILCDNDHTCDICK